MSNKKKKIKKVRKKLVKGGVILGSWKGQSIALIPQYHPESRLGEYKIIKPWVREDLHLPVIIDPRERSLIELKEICEYNNVPFCWITGKSLTDFRLGQNDSIQYDYSFVFQKHS